MLSFIFLVIASVTKTSLFLFRNDLRLADNMALSAAFDSNQDVILLYVYDDSVTSWKVGSASRWWLHNSLLGLQQSIKQLGGQLHLRRGNTLSVLREIIHEANVDQLYFSRTYEPAQRQIEQAIYDEWHNAITIKRYGGYLLFEPEQIKTGQGAPYKVFTPFWKSCMTQVEPMPIARATDFSSCRFFCGNIHSDSIDEWQLQPSSSGWFLGLWQVWQPGEAGAQQRLQHALNHILNDYAEERDRPDREGTSKLSPHLHFGELSPVRVWSDVKQFMQAGKLEKDQAMCFLRELGWREFSTHLLFHWQSLPDSAFRSEYQSFPWKQDFGALTAWQRGETGYPIVDAGMRQLWHSGWMHNRVRMIVGSFLVKHLLIHWREGEDWFWDTLVDADLANNAASWQWVAGSGADAAPYFRIFNPILQGKKFDPDGSYVKKWVPELKNLPIRYIHEPWEADEVTLSNADIALGDSYPAPIVAHAEGRKRALAAFDAFKNG